ncbi:MAG: MCE family protein, partial [Ignavibacteria bacterium]
MKNQTKTEVKVGITVLFGLIILVWIIGWAKNFNPFEEPKLVMVRFDNTAGLEVGDQVQINGVRKGRVESIQNEESGVLVTLNIPKDVNLFQDAEFSIMMLDLMGGKKVEVFPGSSKVEMDYSQIQSGKFKGDISTAMAALSGIQNDLIETVKELKVTLKGVNRIVGDDLFIYDIKKSASSLNKLAGLLNELVIDNRASLEELIKNSNEFVNNTNSSINELKPKTILLIDSLNTVLSDSRKLLNNTNQLLLETKNDDNNLGKLLHDENLSADLKESIAKLKSLLNIL